MEKKIQKKVIMLYTIENTKIITINTKIQEFYPGFILFYYNF